MESFTLHIAQKLYDTFQGDYGEVVLIFPNRRAGLFVQKALAGLHRKSLWAPTFYAIEDFVFNSTGLQAAPQSDLLFHLYDAYIAVETGEVRSFEDFAGWGPKLLQDFGELDAWMANSREVFSYLSEARMLQKWQLDSRALSDFDKEYLRFFQNLEPIYRRFKEILLSSNQAYYELAIRLLAEKPTLYLNDDKHYLIAGFNALTRAEQQLFEFLSQKEKSEILWDGDAYYLDDPLHEAGKFLRRNLKNPRLKSTLIDDRGFGQSKTIAIRGLSGNNIQVKHAARILEEMAKQATFEPEKTAIVLADEQLLIPLLNALPPRWKELNITMSYPYWQTQIYALLNDIFALYEHARIVQDKPLYFYHASLKKIFQSPLIGSLAADELRVIVTAINEMNLSYVSLSQIQDLANPTGFLSDFLQKLYHPIEGGSSKLLSKILDIIQLLLTHDDSLPQSEVWFTTLLRREINRMDELFGQHNTHLQAGTIRRLFMAVTRMKGLPFKGEPLKGLQIMGVLETRMLDFENIIYLSFNEGIIPRTKSFASFILPEIRREYDMPLPHDHDAMFAYHFYRSIQRAHRVFLLYNTSSTGLNEGELSRFGKQLLFELPQSRVKHQIENRIITLPSPVIKSKEPIVIPKTKEIHEQIIRYMSEHGLSPTSLTKLKNCSLQFYFDKILKLRPEDELEETLGAHTRGNAIHETLQEIYCPKKKHNTRYDEAFFKHAAVIYKDILHEKYRNNYKKGNIETGYNYLLKKLDELKLKRFFEMEIEQGTGISEVQCEQKLSYTLKLERENTNIEVKLLGYADRIDKYRGIQRIIDYKTGKVEASNLRLQSKKEDTTMADLLFDGNNTNKDKALQLLVYALLFARRDNFKDKLSPAIISLKGKPQYFYLSWEGQEHLTAENIDEFENMLRDFLSAALDPGQAISGTDRDNYCRYCDFKDICRKEV